MQKKDYDGAIETYTSLIDYDKENANAYYLRGSVYLDTDKKTRHSKIIRMRSNMREESMRFTRAFTRI